MIEDHKHCIVCGKPVEMDKFVCSPSCEEIIKRHQKSASRSRMIMLVVFAVLIVLILVIPYIK
jgi:predicted nucleic acid-binding Zn ribbon protein